MTTTNTCNTHKLCIKVQSNVIKPNNMHQQVIHRNSLHAHITQVRLNYIITTYLNLSLHNFIKTRSCLFVQYLLALGLEIDAKHIINAMSHPVEIITNPRTLKAKFMIFPPCSRDFLS